jgi:hypothetical protein
VREPPHATPVRQPPKTAAGDLPRGTPFGLGGGFVESDETFIGVEPGEPKAKAGGNHTMKVLSTGRARSTVLDFISAKAIGEIVVGQPQPRSDPDDGRSPPLHVEGFFLIFKRGMRGVYQHASKKHLHRYLAEFDFRYSNRVALGIDDTARATLALQGVVGKRLTYRRPDLGAEGTQA